MKLQTRDLVMFALGCEGKPLRWDGDSMEDGIHLRWGFRPDLGFPLGGFDLYRRPHRSGDPLCVGFSGSPGVTHPAPWTVNNLTLVSEQPLKITSLPLPGGPYTGLDLGRGVRITFSEPARWISVKTVSTAAMALTAYQGSMPVDEVKASGTGMPETLIVQGAAIDAVELEQVTGVLIEICQVPVSQGALDHWERLNRNGPIALPMTRPPDYPITHPHAPDDEAEARSRVSPTAWSRYEGQAWADLHHYLEILVDDRIPVPMVHRHMRISGQSDPASPPEAQEPEIIFWPLQQVLAASLDHNLARILGLYWLDREAQPGVAYDYQIVGHWDRAGRVVCPTAVRLDFAQVSAGTTFGPFFEQQGIVFQSALGFEVQEENSPWKDGTDRGIKPLSGFAGIPMALQIRFPKSVHEVQVLIQTASPGASLKAYDRNGVLLNQSVAPTRVAILKVQAPGIDYVELSGDQVCLFGVNYLPQENEPDDRGWIVFNVRRGVPQALPIPGGAAVVQVPGMPPVNPDGSLRDGTNTLAFRWDLPVEHGVIQPGRAVMYHVQRQSLGQQTPVAPGTPPGFEDVSPNPVLNTQTKRWLTVDQGTLSTPSDWALGEGVLSQSSNIYGGGGMATDLPMPGTYALAGRLEWTDYQLTLSLRSDDDDGIGVMFRYQDEKNFYRFSMDSQRQFRRLVKCAQGKYSLLWQDIVAYTVGQTYGLRIVVQGNRLQGWLDGAPLFDVTDGDLTHGLIGLYCWGNTSAHFYAVRVTPTTGESPVFFEDDFMDSMVTPLPTGWPTYPVYLLDGGLADGWYAYRVAGIDIFGRLGGYSLPALIQALDRTPPPHPVMIEAKALQLRPAGVPESIVDRMLTPGEQTWLAAHPAGGIHVSWVWPGEMRRQAPDANEFRIYFQPGRINTIAGWITGVAASGSALSILTTDQNTSLPVDAFKGEKVRVGLYMFTVAASSTGSNFTLTVKNLANPEQATDPSASKWVLPEQAAFSMTIRSSNTHVIDFRKPKYWKDRVHVEALGTLASPTGTITNRVDHSDGTCTLTTDAALGDTQTSDYPNGRTVPGVLISDGQLFIADKHTTGANFKVTLRAIQHGSGAVQPVVGHRFTYYPGYRYTVTIAGLPLNPTSADPVAYGEIGISTADDKLHTPDDPARTGTTWGDRYGNEGSVSPPQTVYAVKRDRPAALTAPPDSKKVYAEPADYYGHSRYTLRWEKASDSALCYLIYRAIDQSLFSVDESLWKGRPFDPLAAGPTYLAAGRWAAIAQELNSLDTTDPDYSGLSNDALQVLASLAANEAAFSMLTEEPLDPTVSDLTDSSDSSGKTLYYTDVLDSGASNCYFYRVAVIDRAGNRSALADSTPPIYLPDTVPPRLPQPIKALGGDKAITLYWQANLEPGMDHYLVYRVDDRAQSDDIRRMGTAVAEVQHPTTAQVSYEDTGLTGATTYYYRLVAVRQGQIGPDTADVVTLSSIASEVMAARAYDLTPPDPPTWVRHEWVNLDDSGAEQPWGSSPPAGLTYTPAVALDWVSSEPYSRWIVQRKVAGTDAWRSISPWLCPEQGKGKFIDQTALPTSDYVYRIRGQDKAGKTNNTYDEADVSKP